MLCWTSSTVVQPLTNSLSIVDLSLSRTFLNFTYQTYVITFYFEIYLLQNPSKLLEKIKSLTQPDDHCIRQDWTFMVGFSHHMSGMLFLLKRQSLNISLYECSNQQKQISREHLCVQRYTRYSATCNMPLDMTFKPHFISKYKPSAPILRKIKRDEVKGRVESSTRW